MFTKNPLFFFSFFVGRICFSFTFEIASITSSSDPKIILVAIDHFKSRESLPSGRIGIGTNSSRSNAPLSCSVGYRQKNSMLQRRIAEKIHRTEAQQPRGRRNIIDLISGPTRGAKRPLKRHNLIVAQGIKRG